MTADRFGYWPEGAAYRTPKPEPTTMLICAACGSRHLDPLPWCSQVNTPEEPQHDPND